MAIVRLTKTFTFEMAHALLNYDGKCKNIHGHSYKLEVTVKGEPKASHGDPADGLLIDFGDLKKLVNREVINIFDHALVIQKDYPEALLSALGNNFARIIDVDYQPTCENLVADYAGRIARALPLGIVLFKLVLHETATAYCEWYAEDQ